MATRSSIGEAVAASTGSSPTSMRASGKGSRRSFAPLMALGHETSRLSKTGEPKPTGVEADLTPARSDPARRLVHRFRRQAKRSPMNGEHQGRPSVWMRRNHILVDPHRFLGIHVHELHEPAWLVGADRDHHEVEGPAPRADLAELRVICRVTSEEHARAGRLQ